MWEFVIGNKYEALPIAIAVGREQSLYILFHDSTLLHLSSSTFTPISPLFSLSSSFASEPTSLAYSALTNELWVGDKAGTLQILGGDDLALVSSIAKKHNHTISVVTSSSDGKLVASGDVYRYIQVFEADTKKVVGTYTYHASKIIHLAFSKDGTGLVSAGMDLKIGIVKLADKSKKFIERAH